MNLSEPVTLRRGVPESDSASLGLLGSEERSGLNNSKHNSSTWRITQVRNDMSDDLSFPARASPNLRRIHLRIRDLSDPQEQKQWLVKTLLVMLETKLRHHVAENLGTLDEVPARCIHIT